MIARLSLTAVAGILLACAAVHSAAAETRKETRMEIVPGGTLDIVDNYGSVVLHGGSGKEVFIASVVHSNKVECDESITPDKRRAKLLVHAKADEKPTPDEARVDYDITVPAGVAVTVSTATGPISVDGLSGDLSFSSETGHIAVHNVARAHLHIRGLTAHVTLTNINLGHVEVTSSGGTVDMVDVAGPKISVGTTSGNISYRGDCSGAGEYNFTTHSGSIDVFLPETASFALSARSLNGSVQNDFPLTQKAHTSFVPQNGRSFAGTSNSGSSSMDLESFSGRIRVKKQ